MTGRSDQEVWMSIERRLAGVERFIPATPAWQPDTAMSTPSMKVVPGRTVVRGTPNGLPMSLAWIVLLALLTLGVVAGTVISGLGSRPPVQTVPPAPSTKGVFRTTGEMLEPRAAHSATRLVDGRVLIFGGNEPGFPLASTAEIFDPGPGTFRAISGAPFLWNPNATLLRDGKVLLTGDTDSNAWLFDPQSESFETTGSMSSIRVGHTSTLLSDGKVLITGGDADRGPTIDMVAVAEVYDPGTGTFSTTGTMNVVRGGHSATLLSDGRVLILGGNSSGDESSEIYDPQTGEFTASGNSLVHLSSESAVLLADGTVLVLGGWDESTGRASRVAELYDPATGGFRITGSTNAPRVEAAATLLDDGTVLITGGGNDLAALAAPSEIYDPRTGTFTTIDGPEIAFESTATRLQDGNVLVAGGTVGSGKKSEVYEFDYEPTE